MPGQIYVDQWRWRRNVQIIMLLNNVLSNVLNNVLNNVQIIEQQRAVLSPMCIRWLGSIRGNPQISS